LFGLFRLVLVAAVKKAPGRSPEVFQDMDEVQNKRRLDIVSLEDPFDLLSACRFGDFS